jgi:hypothetical protein
VAAVRAGAEQPIRSAIPARIQFNKKEYKAMAVKAAVSAKITLAPLPDGTVAAKFVPLDEDGVATVLPAGFSAPKWSAVSRAVHIIPSADGLTAVIAPSHGVHPVTNLVVTAESESKHSGPEPLSATSEVGIDIVRTPEAPKPPDPKTEYKLVLQKQEPPAPPK